MVTIVHTGDWHLTEGPRFQRTLTALHELVESGDHPDLWLVGGDLAGTTVPHRQTPAERNALARIFMEMASRAPVIIPYGNHDYPGDLDVFALLKTTHPILVYPYPDSAWIGPTASGEWVRVDVLPYPSKKWAGIEERSLETGKQGFESALRDILAGWGVEGRATNTVRVLCAHVNIGGSRTAGGEVLIGSEVELAPHDLIEADYDYVALSHIHLCQQFDDRIWYAGSPDRSNFGETDDKGFLLVNCAPQHGFLGVQRIPVSGNRLVTHRARWAIGSSFTPPIPAPTPEDQGAEIRLVITMREDHVLAAQPEIDMVKTAFEKAGVESVKIERDIEPAVRQRAAEITVARSVADKVKLYWATLDDPPDPATCARVLDLLNLIEQEAAHEA